MTKSGAPIGLFDSGVGGLTVLNELKQRFPSESFIYLGDSARNPYGPKTRETILRYSAECSEFLYKKGIKLLVIACNTSSSVAIPTLKGMFDCSIIGMINPAADSAVKMTKTNSIAVIGTRATIGSGAYQRALLDRNSKIDVYPIACPLFVPLVEEGIFDGPLVEQAIDRYLRPVRDSKVDTVILGCTHYPLLKDALYQYFRRPIELVDCGVATADYLEATLAHEGLIKGSGEQKELEDQFFVTDGLERFEELAELILGKTPDCREQIQAF